MRLPKTTSLAVAASLALGGVGAATAFAVDHESTVQSVQSVQAPAPALPGAEKVAEQNRVLSNTSGAIRPVSELIQDVLRTTDGNLSPEAAQKHAGAVERALTKIRQQANRAGEQDLPQDAETGSAGEPAAEAAAAPGETTLRAVEQLRHQVDALLTASTSGEPAKVNSELRATVTATVNLMTSVMLGDTLPPADMRGLPDLPHQPGDGPKG
ncbi:hypothetical protein [Streptomyces oceani]|uniref:Secreted protein n=1 Tax=Streptomyces oceani TaxID=1075402 RepID=A0A1E7KNR7_9ACTN|nr:hypothetical protein [Streptomyces oceani]OEV05557.1 hypothetical protein AN216_02530 [Streptomyces oceani]